MIIFNPLLFLDISIRILIIVCLLLWIITPIYSLYMDNLKKKEIARLCKLNDDLHSILEIPVKKAREIMKNPN